MFLKRRHFDSPILSVPPHRLGAFTRTFAPSAYDDSLFLAMDMASLGHADDNFSSFEVINTDSDNDFGYDFSLEDEEALLQLSSQTSPSKTRGSSQCRFKAGTQGEHISINGVPGKTDIIKAHDDAFDKDDFEHLLSGRAGKVTWDHLQRPTESALPPEVETRRLSTILTEVAYPDLSQSITASKHAGKLPEASTAQSSSTKGIAGDPTGLPIAAAASEESDATKLCQSEEDSRSPLQRFRTFPRRPLTVTDLTSGAWCELQQWYTLTRLPFGRRTRTAAMREGTRIHKTLEDEVHTTVRIEVVSKEDGFGMKLWNLIQGLRTLRETGLTRELEIWGVVDGEVVNGLIDGLTHSNPDQKFEDELRANQEDASSQQPQQHQAALTDYFVPRETQTKGNGKKVYLFDVKTRGTLTPVSKAMLRPAKVQLLLYRSFLADMAADKLDYSKIFLRYGLDQDSQFSDIFLAHMANLHEEALYNANGEHFVDAPQSQEDANADLELLSFPTLRSLAELVRREIAHTFPHGTASLGHLLRVQYLYRGDGREIDSHVFPASEDAVAGYLSGYMPWWRGERRAEGVQIEEAFKCRSCEFAKDCEWREGMDKRMRERAHMKTRSRKSIV